MNEKDFPPVGDFWELGNFNLTPEQNPWKTKMAPFDTEVFLIQYPFYNSILIFFRKKSYCFQFHVELMVIIGGKDRFPDGKCNQPWKSPNRDHHSR